MAWKFLLWLVPVCFILSACPFESEVPLETGPVEPIDSTLVGYWYGIVKDGSDFFGIEALDIKKESDSTYSIVRYGKAAKGDIILPDTSYFTGYTSYIGGQRFMNIEAPLVTIETKGKKAPIVKVEKVYYLASFSTRHDTLDMTTITENFSTSRKGFHTPRELKDEVISLLGKQKNIYDDLYTLSYHKIQKPLPLKPF
jgi:hypothetical protein